MMGIKKTGVTYPDTLKALLIKNLRLPSDIATDDDSLIVSNLKSAIDYLEDTLSISITAKTVTQQWGTDINKYILKWQPTAITSIKINDGDDIKAQAQVVKDSVPSFFYLPYTVYSTTEDNVITCIYTCAAETPAPALEQLIIMLASMYYNNPEGLSVNDNRKVQILLNNYTNII
jgi:hypothetical protein